MLQLAFRGLDVPWPRATDETAHQGRPEENISMLLSSIVICMIY